MWKTSEPQRELPESLAAVVAKVGGKRKEGGEGGEGGAGGPIDT